MDLRPLLKMMFNRSELPENRVLVDPHAHFHKSLKPSEVVQALYEKGVSAQAICDYGLASGNPEHVICYEEFIGRLNERDIEIVNSDYEMTVLRRKNDNRRLILFQGREMEAIVEGSHGGFLHDNHQMHIVVHGMKPGYDSAQEILKKTKIEHNLATIAHPFTIPARKIEFVYANREERDTVVKLAREYGAAVEGLNSTNSLWMTPTNLWVVETAKKERLKLVYASDAHARPNLELTREQVGIAGTTIDRRMFNKAWDEGKLSILINEMQYQGQVFGGVQNPILFYKVMVAPRIAKLLE